MPACAPFDPLGPYVSNVLAWVDCRTLGLGEDAFRALGPGTGFGLALTGLLTIYVALIGYRLLLGGELTVREGMFAALKIGLVLALSTQWPAWRVLVYDVATKTPEAATAGLLRASGLGAGGSDTLAARVDGVNAALAAMISNTPAPAPAPAAMVQAQPSSPAAPILNEAALSSASTATGTLVVSALAGFVGVRMVMGFLLAIGPLLVACLLFAGTRGLFVGWLRAMVGTLFAALAVPAALALQLAILEPQVIALQTLLKAAQPVGALPQQIAATTLVFGIAVLALLAAGACIGLGLVWPRGRLSGLLQDKAAGAAPWATQPRPNELSIPRARQIAMAVASNGLREERPATFAPPPRRSVMPHPADGGSAQQQQFANVPLGQAGRRRTFRQSTTAQRRDDLR